MKQQNPSSITHALDGNLCTGCGLCAALAPEAIQMGDETGWLRPQVLDSVSEEAETLINATCPALGVVQPLPKGANDHVLWGPIAEVRTGHATNESLRYKASSGGVLSALLTHLIETGVVEYVLQTGPDLNNPLGNATVISRERSEIAAAAGSRYAPSAPLEAIETLLSSEARFAFVGKPCDVAALRALSHRDDRVSTRVPIMISFFCAGVPSYRGTEQIVKALGIQKESVKAFRYRGDGWPGRARATCKDGTTRSMSYSKSWGEILSKHLQFRCKICPDGIGGAADVVCADAWDTDSAGYPLFEEKAGISLVVSRTEAGEALVRAAEAAGKIATRPLDVDRIGSMQPGQLRRRRSVLMRLTMLKLMGRQVPRFRGFHLAAAARQAGLLKNLREALATLKRVLCSK